MRSCRTTLNELKKRLTFCDKVEAKCAGHQRGSPLRYVESDFLNIGTVWPSTLKTSSIPVHLASINQERE